ncbi:MAG: LamG-like jellyroll fold domain-containing protein, partial [Novosphingobium sp.]|nr:LamG-like jellyroll fold domain-containing protein [Novosphingobium sp.]
MGERKTNPVAPLLLSLLAAAAAFSIPPTALFASEPHNPAPVLRWTFDGRDDQRSARPAFESQFPQPELVPGIKGKGWRSDGFSSAATGPLRLDARSGFTASAWIALESYPSADELPIDRQRRGSLFQQATAKAGFDLFIDTYGNWGLRVSTGKGSRTVRATDRFPLYRWVHVAASYDPGTGLQRLALNGQVVGEG